MGSSILHVASWLLSMKLAHAVHWTKGSDGLSCTSICADLGGCAEFWPRSESEFVLFMRQAKLDGNCLTYDAGGARYDPSSDGLDCGWMADMPREKRCDIKAPNGVYRLCPCGTAPAFRPSPGPDSGTVVDESGYIEPEESPSPAMPGLQAPTPSPAEAAALAAAETAAAAAAAAAAADAAARAAAERERTATTTGHPPVRTCPYGIVTCENGITLARDPKLDCEFPTCPTEKWPVYCTVCPEMDTCEDHCSGEEVQSLPCPDLPTCPDDHESFHSCQPSDCQWAQWSEWVTEGCTGLCNRTRTFKNSVCGGNPCGGRVHETKVCDSPCNPNNDCVFGDWNEWSVCNSDNFRTRMRIIDMPEHGGGKPCKGPLLEQQSCQKPRGPGELDCVLSDWFMWSGCTETCGGGQNRRVRSILKRAESGGKQCTNSSLEEIASCAVGACPDAEEVKIQDCYFGDWESWSSCFEATNTRIRKRYVGEGNVKGRACNGTVEETDTCKDSAGSVDCELSTWTTWTLCSKTCDAGQTYRSRNLKAEAKNGRACTEPIMQTRACHDHPCNMKEGFNSEGSCHLSGWSQWSGCSEKCGQGVEKRTRKVLQEAMQGGLGCDGNLEEVRGCGSDTPDCANKDCTWMDWTEWSDCSATCGGGSHKRFRNVKAPPLKDGKLCSALPSTQEIRPCNNQTCPNECVDGVWGQWTEWGACSRTCGKGFEWRSRHEETKATICGKPAVGDLVQERPCQVMNCQGDKDCAFGVWSLWTACSKSCWGFTSRTRSILHHSEGDGRPCANALEEKISCNGPENVTDTSERQACHFGIKADCQYAAWGAWSPCTKSCGGGVHQRSRSIAKESNFGGRACFEALHEVQKCQAEPCNPNSQECVWEDWEDWSICSKCEGERHRKRKISQLPVGDVPECKGGIAQEVTMCPRDCGNELYYCIWNDWSIGACSHTCGKGSKPWVRNLQVSPLYPSDDWRLVGKLHDKGEQCEGSEVKYEECSNLPLCGLCEEQDCLFGSWSQWSAPTCNGLCSRNRSIARPNNECGRPCSGHFSETMACQAPNCGGQDCQIGLWTEWDDSKCSQTGEGQKTRTRNIATPQARGGAACEDDLSETVPCSYSPSQMSVPCRLDDWGEWSPCDRTCGNGQRTRERTVEPARNGGKPCGDESGSLEVRIMEPCIRTPCAQVPDTDCALSEWSQWSKCRSASDQAYRERVVATPASGNGQSCNGGLKETGACPPMPKQDCELSEWHDWGNCDASCGGGSKFRTREVLRPAQNGGQPCNMVVLHESDECGETPCPTSTDCIVSDWHAWSACSPTCGPGVSTRFRNVTQPAQADSEGCNLKMVEVLSCKGGECPDETDCKLSDWGSWSECQRAEGCGIGYRSRSRQVEREASPGGHPCDLLPMQEVKDFADCPGQCHEDCIDGYWQQWTLWSSCSVSCGLGGSKKRTRRAIEGTKCGASVEGLGVEYVQCAAPACPTPTDCTWMKWSEWEACSASCNGQKTRRRDVGSQAKSGGKACEGASVESARCNPSSGESAPFGCPVDGVPKDCKLADWDAWSPCTLQCEGGYTKRSRNLLQGPEYGGKSCEEHLEEINSCNTQPCVNGNDCQWTDWEDWSACDKDSKQKTRHRKIGREANHGRDCEGSNEDVAACITGCEDTLHYCVWSDWSSWSYCSTTCGMEGRITRKRIMTADSDGTLPTPSRRLSEFSTLGREDMEGLATERMQELVIAFLSGLLSLAAALSLQRWIVRRPQATIGIPMNPSGKHVQAWGLPQ